MDEPAAPKIETELVAELEARRLICTVEDHGTAKVLMLTCDDQQVAISSEPGRLTTAAGGFEELAREALAVAEILRARAKTAGAPDPLLPRFTGQRITS
jgi:hypothetical protein